nr:M20/M25/M40 family metallo-hydrolase [Kyrpidia spormannii]
MGRGAGLDCKEPAAAGAGEHRRHPGGRVKRPEGDPDFSASFQVLDDRPCTETDPGDPVVRAVAEAYRAVTGREPVYNGVPGATDGTFLHAWAGIPVVTTGAGSRTLPHQVDEYVDVEELVITARMYAEAARRFLAGSGAGES